MSSDLPVHESCLSTPLAFGVIGEGPGAVHPLFSGSSDHFNMRRAAGIEVSWRSQAIVATPAIIRAADNVKGGLGLEGSHSEILAAPEFPVLPQSLFWTSSYLNTAEKK